MQKLVLVCLLISGSTCAAQQPPILDELFHRVLPAGVPFVWPTNSDEASNDTIRGEDVLRFFQQLFPEGSLVRIYAIESFRFVPLEKDKFYLVAVTDGTGRGFFNDLQIVWCERNNCEMTSQPSDGGNDLHDQLTDIEGDGVFKVITRERAGPYEGGQSRPIYVYAIRSLANGEMVDVSNKYPDYFRNNILPRMEAERKNMAEEIAVQSKPRPIRVSDLDGSRTPNAAEEAARREGELEMKHWQIKSAAEMQYVQDDYHRRVLGEKTGGLENALKWARSEDPDIQRFGVQALEPIDSPAAAAELLRIARTGASQIAEDASHALQRRLEVHLAAPPQSK